MSARTSSSSEDEDNNNDDTRKPAARTTKKQKVFTNAQSPSAASLTNVERLKRRRANMSPEEKQEEARKQRERYQKKKEDAKNEWDDLKQIQIIPSTGNKHMFHIAPPPFPKYQATVTVMEGFGEFLIKGKEWVQQTIASFAPKEYAKNDIWKQSHMTPPSAHMLDGDRWELFLTNSHDQQSIKCFETLAELFCQHHEQGKQYFENSYWPRQKAELLSKDMQMYVTNIIQKDPDYGALQTKYKNLQINVRSVILNYDKVVAQKVHSDLHVHGKQYFVHLYDGAPQAVSGVATTEFKMPSSCVTTDGNNNETIKVMDYKYVIKHWKKNIPKTVEKDLMKLFERKSSEALRFAMSQHGAMLCDSSDKWEKLHVTNPDSSVLNLPPGTVTSLKGGVPHAGPKVNHGRVIIFATLEPTAKGFATGNYNVYESYTSTTATMRIITKAWKPKLKIHNVTKKWLLQRLAEASKRDYVRSIQPWKTTHAEITELYKQMKAANSEAQVNALIDKYLNNNHTEPDSDASTDDE